MADKTSPKAKKAPKPAPSHPKTYDMVLEALASLASNKGASVPGTKNYIVEKYPTVEPQMLKSRLKKAFAKGFEEGTIVRPKGFDDLGSSMTGRFKLNKAKMTELEKANKPKKKLVMKVEDKKPKTKTLAKTSSKSKSPKAKAIKELTKAKKNSTSATTKKSPKKALKKAGKTIDKTTKPKPKKQPQKSPKTPKTPSQKTAKARVKKAKVQK